MTVDRSTLLAYLRQLGQAGERTLFLENLTAAAALALLRQPRAAELPVRERTGSALEVLQQEAFGCVRCRLHEGRKSVVFGEGNPNADVMIVGEAPGQEEDRTGRPFVGQAGKLLDLLLMTAGFPRPNVYICNTLKCRPPNNRNPLPDEMEQCSSFLHGQIDAVAPRVLIAVGKFAVQALLNTEESVGRLRGQVHSFRGTPLVVTYHPAYLLRSPQAARLAWQDLQLVRQVLDEQA
ncbi:MAG TPA: uracil-DNA glycosylase [Longimicrobiales bacterium]|nr:uracil-DNA glycosylase [Longimicrobiales bacterium]